jgi:hypothetical protein
LTNSGNPLFRKQYLLPILFCLGCALHAQAQKGREIYRPFHDNLVYYFGLTLGYNSSYLHLEKSTKFIQSDSIIIAEPKSSGGITMGLLATARMNDHFQFRINPQLVIGGAKSIDYTLTHLARTESAHQSQILPATLVSFPFQIKFNSDRIDNFRTYMMAGLKYDIDLSSNSTARNAEDLIKMKKYDFGYELAVGFNFYLPFVTISPELKISNGLSNLQQVDPTLKYSNVLERILSRMVCFSIHFED